MITKQEVIKLLSAGQIGIMPTDTIYGLVGQALNRETVERIYKVRRRSPGKPLIVLISSVDNLKSFGISLDYKEKMFLNKFWPGQVSVILPCKSSKFKYLHRGTKTLAIRLPKKKSILEILKKTGPLVAPSANPEGLPPANNLKEAKGYFGKISIPSLNPSLRKGGRKPESRDQKKFPLPLRRGGLGRGLGVDFYYGRGTLKSAPSTLVKLENGKIKVLREGAVRIKKQL